MGGWIRRLAAALCVCVGLTMGIGFAEVADWAAAQEAGEDQVRWAEAIGGGDAVNTSVQASDVTKKCQFKVSEGDKGHLTEDKVSLTWKYDREGAWIGIKVPDDITPGAIRIEWMFDCKGFELDEYDAQKNLLRKRTQADTFPSIYTMFTLMPETRLIQLKMTAMDQEIGRIRVYSEGILPKGVQTWLPPVEKADMMVFSTHQDDEVLWLGGTIPYSDVVCRRPTVTVYMTNCTRERRREALDCLWEMGSRTYPEFINLQDKRVDTIKEGIELWGGKDKILEVMVQRIRRYKPEVIVTQDLNGEYGHNQHKIMARATRYAIEAAADPTRYPDSYKMYGAWQVKKLYIHLYKENEIKMDWLTPQPACGGLTLLQVAANGMEKHASQTKYYSVKEGGKYDNSLFGLALTTVGEDVEKNDFFEHIPQNASAEYLAENPTGVAAADVAAIQEAATQAEPDAASADADVVSTDMDLGEDADADAEPAEDGDAPVVDEAPVDVIPEDAEPVQGGFTAEPAPKQVTSERGGSGLGYVLIGAGVALAGGCGWYVYRRLRGRHHRRYRRGR